MQNAECRMQNAMMAACRVTTRLLDAPATGPRSYSLGHRESLLVELRQRIRDVRQGPDELIYLLTDADDGAVLRIEPAP
jgi:glucose/arabinose dehydrogenase